MEQKIGQKIKSKAAKSNWRRSKKRQQKASSSRQNLKIIQKVIKKAKENPLSTRDITLCLNKMPNFAGVFSSDQLKNVSLRSYPVFLVVNIDTALGQGLHWLCIRIDQRTVEIFDSLGFNPSLWKFYPKYIFQFISSFRYSHKFCISPVLQPSNSLHCGAYCVYFVLFRQKVSFAKCLKPFSKHLCKNFRILCSLVN